MGGWFSWLRERVYFRSSWWKRAGRFWGGFERGVDFYAALGYPDKFGRQFLLGKHGGNRRVQALDDFEDHFSVSGRPNPSIRADEFVIVIAVIILDFRRARQLHVIYPSTFSEGEDNLTSHTVCPFPCLLSTRLPKQDA